MISSFFEASTVLRNPSIKDFALKSLDRLMSLNYRIGEGMYHFYDGEPHLLNQLADQMETTTTLCFAYELTDDEDYVGKAEEVMRTTVEKLYDKEHGGFYDTSIDSDAPGFLSKPVKPLHENSIAALALIKLHYLTENRAYHEMAEETLKHFVNIFPQFGYMAADYALAVDLFLNEPTIIRIIGSLEETRTLEFLTEAHRIYEPRKIIKILNPSRDKDDITKMGYTKPDNPTAFVCVGRHCTTPITEPAHIASELTKLFQTR